MVTLFLAAMQGVSRDLYEAAWVDGAGRWYRFLPHHHSSDYACDRLYDAAFCDLDL